jgi:DivIVA domain-containing protein
MSISAHDIRARQFTTVKRGGYDQREVEAFRTAAAEALEKAAQEATAMEARARAAVAKLKEAQAAAEAASAAPAREPAVAVDESETISRTLLLAQRTADQTVAEAEQQAAALIEAAKADSRKAGEAERVRVEGEVQALLARRDFLESDVDHLEQFLASQRERISAVAAELNDLTTRADGLGGAPRPQLSASDTDHAGVEADTGAAATEPGDEEEPDVAELIEQAASTEQDSERHSLFVDEPR